MLSTVDNLTVFVIELGQGQTKINHYRRANSNNNHSKQLSHLYDFLTSIIILLASTEILSVYRRTLLCVNNAVS